MKTLIFGSNGQIGRALNMLSDGEVVALNRAQADFSKPDSLPAIVRDIQPDIIINAAAYTAVDNAEEEEALATCINAEAPGALACVAAQHAIPFVHYSTDYVFDGSGDAPWKEGDTTAPLNAYGRSKRAGELAVQEAGGHHLIFRTSWVYDGLGKNFLTTMLRLGAEREQLRIVDDQTGAPSYAPHLAAATLKALAAARKMARFPSGIYHLCNSGETSWRHFAEAIFAGARRRGIELAINEVLPITSQDYPTPAARPLNSRLDCTKLHATFGVELPDWQAGLNEALEYK